MWVLVALWFTGRRRLAANIVLGWLLAMAILVTVTAPGQLYLRSVNPTSPAVYPVDPEIWLLGAMTGPAVIGWVIHLLTARSKRQGARHVKRLPPAHR
jgi:hypothetical protein